MVNHFPPIVLIQANGLPDAWYKAVKECMTRGAINNREYGKPVRTRSIISVIEIGNPLQEPTLHSDFPTGELHLKEYLKQWERGYKWKEQGFAYNYLDRLINYPITEISSRSDGYFKVPRKPFTESIDQLKTISCKITDRIKKAGETGEECLVSNRDRMVTWVPERDLFVSEDQPCMQSIQIFIYSYPKIIDGEKKIIAQGKGEFHVIWRSRDLYSAWNSNMVGLTLMLHREIFEPNNIKIARSVDFCNNMHIYESDWESAAKVKPANVNLYASGLTYED